VKLEIFMMMKIHVTVFLGYDISTFRVRMEVAGPPKHRYLTTSLHGVMAQKTMT
jgi:hypothetical protein